MNIRFLKYFSTIFVLLSLLNLTFSIGLYDEQGFFNYYINNPIPQINITIFSPAETIFIDNATIFVNNNKQISWNIDENLIQGQEKSYSFQVSDTDEFSPTDDLFLKLFAFGKDLKPISSRKTPTDIYLKLDLIPPTPEPSINLSQIQHLSYKDESFKLPFQEEILEYEIYLSGELILSKSAESSFEKDYNKIINLDLKDSLSEGINNLKIIAKDFAQNIYEKDFQINYRAEPLKITLLTKKNDSSLTYFYDSRYPELFNGKIYTSSSSTIFKVKTNKRANCYYADDTTLTKFLDLNSISEQSKKTLSTQDGITHTITISSSSKFLIACQSPTFNEEISYLSTEIGLGSNLIELVLDTTPSLKIENSFPNTLTSQVPFSVGLDTNKNAICQYRIDSSNFNLFPTQAKTSFIETNISLSNGPHKIEFSCFDVLSNQVSKTNSFTVDTNSGIRILGKNKFFTSTSSYEISVLISSQSANCAYSQNKSEKASNFGNLSKVDSNNNLRSFKVSNLNDGENTFYLYCENDGEVNSNEIIVIYDKLGPVIESVKFVNNNIESNYLSSYDYFFYKAKVKSLIDIDYFNLTFKGSGKETFSRKTSSSSAKIVAVNLSGYNKVEFIAVNELGKKSKIFSKSLLFDLEKPLINILVDGNKVEIKCSDVGGSGCNKIYYGLSKTIIGCSATMLYDIGSSQNLSSNTSSKAKQIDILDYGAICVRAIDNVGNIAEKSKILLAGEFTKTSSDLKDLNNNSLDLFGDELENQTQNFTAEDDFTDDENIEDPLDINLDENQTSDSNSPNYILIASIVLILVGVSGGGFYAYKKGYLNSELEKLGILKPTSSTNKSLKGNLTSTSNKAGISNILNNRKKENKVDKKSSYDAHLKKLNNFINEHIDEKAKVFDTFKTDDHKGKVKGYRDTLIDDDKLKAHKVSKEDFDEFYSDSKSSNLEKSLEKSLKDEAVGFEQYYNEKKKKQNQKK